jgi:hypothetical protein
MGSNMAFLFWKRFKTISDLRTADLKLKKVRRSDVKIAIIDDEPIEIMDILKSHKFNIDLIPKIESINILGEYDIIICDIHGVGEAFSKEFQGAYLVKEIYKQYPFKIIISYTGITYDARYNEYLKHAEFSLKKDVSSEDFVEKLDAAISLIQDPVHRWNKIKNYLVENDVPTYEIALIEDDFVRRLLSNQDFNDFPKKKIQKNIDSNLRAVLQSFAANILSKILIG